MKNELIYTSSALQDHRVVPECNPGGDTDCACKPEDVRIDTPGDFGEVTSNDREENSWVNAIGYKSFTENFTNGSPITLDDYQYSGEFRIPALPVRDIKQTVNSEAVHLMIQLWDGRSALFQSDRFTLEGVIFWELNPWSPDLGKIKVYTGSQPSRLVNSGITLRPDLAWHSFKLAVDLVNQKYLFIAIDGRQIDLSRTPLARVQHLDWGNDVTLNITTESMAAYPQKGCPYVFTWTTQFRDLAFGHLEKTGP